MNNSAKPQRKVWAGGVGALSLGGALATIILWLCERLNGAPLPTEVAGAITVLVTTLSYALVAYMVPNAPGEGDGG